MYKDHDLMYNVTAAISAVRQKVSVLSASYK